MSRIFLCAIELSGVAQTTLTTDDHTVTATACIKRFVFFVRQRTELRSRKDKQWQLHREVQRGLGVPDRSGFAKEELLMFYSNSSDAIGGSVFAM